METLILVGQSIEHLEQCIDNGLTECIGRFADLFVALVARGKGEVSALLGDDSLGALDRPLCEVAAVRDGHRLGLLIHLRFLSVFGGRVRLCGLYCVRADFTETL